jgi:hypothetical protein
LPDVGQVSELSSIRSPSSKRRRWLADFYRERIAAHEDNPGSAEQWESKFKKLVKDGKLIPEKGLDAVALWLHYIDTRRSNISPISVWS